MRDSLTVTDYLHHLKNLQAMSRRTIYILIAVVIILVIVAYFVFSSKYIVLDNKVFDKKFIADRNLIPTDLQTATTQTI
jgi:hypothetical protein